MILKPLGNIKYKQINLDKSKEPLAKELRKTGKYCDEILILQDKYYIAVEKAKTITARDAQRLVETYYKLKKRRIKVSALILVYEKSIKRRDLGLINAILTHLIREIKNIHKCKSKTQIKLKINNKTITLQVSDP